MPIAIEHASIGKRIGAWLLDIFFWALLTAVILFIASAYVNFEDYVLELEPYYEKFETLYNTDFSISQDEFSQLSAQQQQNYNDAYQAMFNDPEASVVYAKVILKYLAAVAIAGAVAFLLLEFLLPALQKRGQTLGKIICSIAVIRPNGVRATPFQLFLRAIPGKFCFALLLPLCLFVTGFLGLLGSIGLIGAFGLGLLQLILMLVSPNRSALHDLFSGTVAVDQNFQRIFDNEADLEEYLSSAKQ